MTSIGPRLRLTRRPGFEQPFHHAPSMAAVRLLFDISSRLLRNRSLMLGSSY